jgi:outer membrane immunogenic protein
MNRITAATIASLALGLMIQGAEAADMSTIPPEPMEDWSGFYIGLHGGWGWGDADFSIRDSDFTDNSVLENGFSTDLDGPVAGAQIGFNWQINNFLLGIEADGSWSGIDGDLRIEDIEPPPPGYPFNADTDIDWLASIRGRAGLVWNTILLYATGGIAFASLDVDADTTVAGYPTTIHDSDSGTTTGWVLGGGVEAMLGSNITGRLEFLHYDFSNEELSFNFDPQSDSYFLDVEGDLDVNVIRAGLNFLF